MSTYPRSAYDHTGGLVYFARMCDKIRLKASGSLPEDYQANVGKGFDGRMCRYLRVDYARLQEVVLGGATDEEALAWCYANGRALDDLDVLVWNGYATRRGWRDDGSAMLQEFKASSGLADRADIETSFDYYDVDEGRKV